jgi:hypothetical protein
MRFQSPHSSSRIVSCPDGCCWRCATPLHNAEVARDHEPYPQVRQRHAHDPQQEKDEQEIAAADAQPGLWFRRASSAMGTVVHLPVLGKHMSFMD